MKLLIRKLIRKIGYDIVRYNYKYTSGKLDRSNILAEYNWLIDYGCKTIIDIGANEGQYSDKLRLLFPEAMIYAFEPIPQIYTALKKNFISDRKFKAFNLAIGESFGQVSFYENKYSQSSSILEQSENLARNFLFASEAKQIKVELKTLDRAIESERIEFPILVKIDVQGYEDHVINGGLNTISKASVVICEVSFVHLYKDQPLFSDILEKMKGIGFEYSGSFEQLRSSKTNQILQADAIFIKKI